MIGRSQLKRLAQLCVIALLAVWNLNVATARTAEDPQWECENITCPILVDLCYLAGGENQGCYWDEAEQECVDEGCLIE